MNHFEEIGRLFVEHREVEQHIVCLESVLGRIASRFSALSLSLQLVNSAAGLQIQPGGISTASSVDPLIKENTYEELAELLVDLQQSVQSRDSLADKLTRLGGKP